MSRSTIRVRPDEARLFDVIYVANGVFSDRYPKNPPLWRQFTDQWNALTGRNDTPEDIQHYMVTRRKWGGHPDGKLPCLGGAGRKDYPEPANDLSAEEIAKLGEICLAIGEGSDNLAFDSGLADEVGRRFAAATGRGVAVHVLIRIIFAKRKRGEWVKVGRMPTGPFGDMDQVAV
jgi:hypothetical protein